jgi:predicted DsbA family dithiol-disulfide isomerase
MDTTQNKFTIEIWSDIVCPFCYLGKRKFEAALDQFPEKEQIVIEWKSFQLNPGVVTDTSTSIYTYLAQTKGMSEDVAKQMTAQITARGKEVNIMYNFDKTKVINTFNAHCLLHFAKDQGLQDQAKERLLKAYFTEAENVDDHANLLRLGEEIGLDRMQLDHVLKEKVYAQAVQADMDLAQQFGVGGVPFFVFNRKYAVSGAQESPVFLDTLLKSFGEWKENNPNSQMTVKEGKSCAPDKACE